MNLIQTALLALPAAITGFLGALSFSSDSGSELKIAALAGQTEFPGFTGEQILVKWKTEMLERKGKEQKRETQLNDANQMELDLREKRNELVKLTTILSELEITMSRQKHITELDDWGEKVKPLLHEINNFKTDGFSDKFKDLNSDSFKKTPLKSRRDEFDKLKNSIEAKQKALEEKTKGWDRDLRTLQMTWKQEMNQK